MAKRKLGGTVLVVEDEVPLLNALCEKFEREGLTALRAVNGEEGLQQALEKHPDLILLDLLMPRMDGMTMMGKLRQDAWGKSVPILILTNLSEAEKVDEAVRHQVFDFFVKSDWKLEDIVTKVKQKLQG